MTKKKSQVKAKSPAARKVTKKKGSTQPSQTKTSDDQTNMKPKKADSIQETKNQIKVAKKTSNLKKETSMTSKAEIKERATQTQKKQVNPVELEVAGAFVLCERHKHTINEVILCLESETPFCFLQSEVASYLEYYKEVIIDCLKSKELELLFFDPKFGDDLSVILNKELENIDMALIGSSKVSGTRKILVVDNESFAKNLDWELIDSLRLELKAANLGAFSIDPRSEKNARDPNVSSVVSSFQSFELPKVNRKELKILKEYISAHPETSELADKLLKTSPEKEVKGQVSSETDQNSILQKLGNLITRK